LSDEWFRSDNTKKGGEEIEIGESNTNLDLVEERKSVYGNKTDESSTIQKVRKMQLKVFASIYSCSYAPLNSRDIILCNQWQH